MADKKLISQRWDENFHQSVKNISEQLNMSITDLTIEGLKLMLELSNDRDLFMLSSEERLSFIIEAVLGEKTEYNEPSRIRNSQPGFVTNRISEFLMENQGTLIATTQISGTLKIPQSSVRRSVQELSNNSEFTLVEGRPNFIGYKVK